LHPGKFEFNEIQPWAYHKLPEVFGGKRGYLVRTEGEFDEALRSAWADTSNLSLIHVMLEKDDHSQALERLTEKLSKRV
jgi:indolepyruvate decarboxylase